MPGFGGFQYGHGQWGGIHVDAPVVADDLLVQPESAQIGSPILIASTDGGITDISRDDSFTTFDPIKWNLFNTGVVTTSIQNGFNVELHKVGGGSSSTITSIDTFVSGDITLDYSIISEYLSDAPSQELIYASLQMAFVNGDTLTIKRKAHTNFNGQSIQVDFRIGSVFGGGASISTTSSSGSFRLIKRNNILAALSDNTLLFYSKVNPLGDFNVKLISTTSGQSEYLKTRYKLFKSNTGVMIGDTPLYIKDKVTQSRILGIVPSSSFVGPVDVYAFNHDGDIGQSLLGFTYPLVLGQSLSSNAGVHGNIQNDSVIR